MTPAEEEVLKRAVQFIQGDLAQQDLRDLRATTSRPPSRLRPFFALAEAVEELPESVRKRYEQK